MSLQEQGTAPETGAADDLRSQITEAFDNPSPEPAAAAEAIVPQDDAAPARGPDGRFIQKTPAEAAPVVATPAQPETPDPLKAQGDSKAPLAPPAGWSDAGKVKWNKLPREIQQELARATPQADPALSEQVKRWEPIAQLFEPKKALLQQRGWTEADAIRHLMSASDALDRDPAAALKWLAQSYNVDLAKLVGAPQAEPTEYVDPQIKSLTDKLSTLERSLQTREHAEASAELERFRGEKDASGNPLRPHFDAVRGEMHRLFAAGLVTTLADAYERAVWSNPDLRQKAIDETLKAKEAERLAAAEQARKAAVSIQGAPLSAAAPPPASKGSVRADLESAFGEARV